MICQLPTSPQQEIKAATLFVFSTISPSAAQNGGLDDGLTWGMIIFEQIGSLIDNYQKFFSQKLYHSFFK